MTISSKTSDHFLPQIRYRDVEASTRWLCNALGFTVHLAVRDYHGVIDYVHLTHGQSNVIIKHLDGDELVEAAGTSQVQSQYIFVDDVFRHYAMAKAEGAQIVIEMRDVPQLGRGYTCRDSEGLIWSFGSFDPWQFGLTQAAAVDASDNHLEPTGLAFDEPELRLEPALQIGDLPAPYVPGGRRQASPRNLIAALMTGGLIGAITVAVTLYASGAFTTVEAQLAAERAQRERSETATRHTQEALVGERSAKEQFESAARHIEAELVAVKADKVETEGKLLEAQSDLGERTGSLSKVQEENTALANKLSENEKQWQAVEQSLTERLDKARATAVSAQSERAAIEATLSQRVFTLETSLRDEQKARQTTEATRAASDADLRDARQGRRQAETTLQTVMANLKEERLARVQAEQRAEKLRSQLAARRGPVRKIVRAKPQPRTVAGVKAKSAPPAKVSTSSNYGTYSAGDIGFQP